MCPDMALYCTVYTLYSWEIFHLDGNIFVKLVTFFGWHFFNISPLSVINPEQNRYLFLGKISSQGPDSKLLSLTEVARGAGGKQ